MTILGPLDAYVDQLDTARGATAELLEVARREGPEAARRLASDRLGHETTSAFLMAIGKAARSENPTVAFADLLARLDDAGWADEAAARLVPHDRIGVASIGSTTRLVLEATEGFDRALPELIVPSLTVARGLGYLDMRAVTGDPLRADVFLLPGVAQTASVLWTSRQLADLALKALVKAMPLVVACHPVATLDETDVADFTPPDTIADIEV